MDYPQNVRIIALLDNGAVVIVYDSDKNGGPIPMSEALEMFKRISDIPTYAQDGIPREIRRYELHTVGTHGFPTQPAAGPDVVRALNSAYRSRRDRGFSCGCPSDSM